MTTFIPNDVVDLLRSTPDLVDEFGDPVDDDAVLVADLAAYISDQSKRTYDPVSGQVTVINTYTVRLRPRDGLTVLESDRVRASRTGRVYMVDQVSESYSPVQRSDIVLMCKRIR